MPAMPCPGVTRLAVPKTGLAGAGLTAVTSYTYAGPGEMLVFVAFVMSTGTLPWKHCDESACARAAAARRGVTSQQRYRGGIVDKAERAM